MSTKLGACVIYTWFGSQPLHLHLPCLLVQDNDIKTLICKLLKYVQCVSFFTIVVGQVSAGRSIDNFVIIYYHVLLFHHLHQKFMCCFFLVHAVIVSSLFCCLCCAFKKQIFNVKWLERRPNACKVVFLCACLFTSSK